MGKKSPSTTSCKRSAKSKPAASGLRPAKSRADGGRAATAKSARGNSLRRSSVTLAFNAKTLQVLSDLLKAVSSGGWEFYSQGALIPEKSLLPTTGDIPVATKRKRKRTASAS